LHNDWSIDSGGFSHTIFYGDVIDNDSSLDISDGDFLDNSGGYHSFPGSDWANVNEVWSQHVLPTERFKYRHGGKERLLALGTHTSNLL
jgi:hypothetical protein